MSLMTSLYPDTHGVVHPKFRLADDIWTLAEVLRRSGFATAAYTDGGFMAGAYGFADGFDLYDDNEGQEVGASTEHGFARTFHKFSQWLGDHADQDFFLFLHTFDIHGPYERGEPFECPPPKSGSDARLDYLRSLGGCDYLQVEHYQSLEQMIAAYDGGIRYADDYLGRLFDRLKELGLYDQATIIVTSDHGESFLDENVYAGHGMFVYDDEMHVPLVIKMPENRQAGERHSAFVESIDVMPTIFDMFGIAGPETLRMQGKSFLPVIRDEVDETAFRSFVIGTNPANLENYTVRDADWRLVSPINEVSLKRYFEVVLLPSNEQEVRSRLPAGPQLVRPGHPTENLAGQHPEEARKLADLLLRWKKDELAFRSAMPGREERGKLHDWEEQNLRALGYIR